jgi:hypothetical protein
MNRLRGRSGIASSIGPVLQYEVGLAVLREAKPALWQPKFGNGRVTISRSLVVNQDGKIDP